MIAVGLAALVLTVTLSTWLNARGERSAPPASTDAAVLETPAGVGPIEGPLNGRHALTVDGVPFSFRVPTSGWEQFGSIHISKSTAGSQGAEALIYWSRFPGGVDADWCVLDHTEPGPSVAGVADAVSTATGAQLLTGPSVVTIGGRSAKYMVLIVREDVGCDPGFFYNWKAKLGGALWTETKPGDTIRVWIVDVDGTLLFIAGATKPEAGPRLEQEIQQIVGSIRFD